MGEGKKPRYWDGVCPQTQHHPHLLPIHILHLICLFVCQFIYGEAGQPLNNEHHGSLQKNTKNWYTIDALGATSAIFFGNFDNLDTLDPIYKLQDLKITLGS